MARMTKKVLEAKAARLIRSKRIEKKAKSRADALSAEVEPEMARREMAKLEVSAGRVTRISPLATVIDPAKLYELLGDKAFKYMKVTVGQVEGDLGKDWTATHAAKAPGRPYLKTAPAKKADKELVTVGGSV